MKKSYYNSILRACLKYKLGEIGDKELMYVLTEIIKKNKNEIDVQSGVSWSGENSIIINNRWQMFEDGTVYDTEKGEDISQGIFELRNFILKNHKKMEWKE